VREALTEFLQEVRRAGLPISIAESIDALRAASAVVAERETLREALAAAVVKDEEDRPAFDDVFDRFFDAGDEPGKRRRRAAERGEAEGFGRGRGEGSAGEKGVRQLFDARSDRTPTAASKGRLTPFPRESPRPGERLRRSRRRELLRKPFRDMDPLEAEELVDLAAMLSRRFRARLRRRARIGRRGRVDFRRTLRRSVSHGGVPFDVRYRRRRPGRPDLVALCDISGSVRTATDFFATVLAPCAEFFRRVRLFVFIDRLVEASIDLGRLVPHERVDFHAFSDFGRVLADLDEARVTIGRTTVVVVLGDARNNRRPARADLLARLRIRARTLWWLNPEVRSRWGAGDSAIDAYRPHCDALLECASGAELLRALARLTR